MESDPVATEMPEYEAHSREPKPAQQYGGVSILTNGIYHNYDLGYYAKFYADYKTFILSDDYYSMKREIRNSTLVCVNYDVNVNGTYLGVFTCPMPGLSSREAVKEFTACCGKEFAEFCCFDEGWLNNELLYGGLALGGILIGVTMIGIMCYMFLGRKATKSFK